MSIVNPNLSYIDHELPVFPQYAGADNNLADVFASPQAGKLKLFVFAQGEMCVLCNEQLRIIQDIRSDLNSSGIEPHFISVDQTDPAVFKHFDVWDQIEDKPLHGIFLMDDQRKLWWYGTQTHAIVDKDFLRKEMLRLAGIARSFKFLQSEIAK